MSVGYRVRNEDYLKIEEALGETKAHSRDIVVVV